jgi:predicted GIY-YIG superfamily endonuclease
MEKQVRNGKNAAPKLYKFSYEEWINRDITLRISKEYKKWVRDWKERLWYSMRVT